MKKIWAVFVFCAVGLAIGFSKPEPIVYLPKNKAGRLAVAVWLQGYRGYPGVIKESYFQSISDKLGIAIVGFPATTELGDDTQQWSEEPVADHAYVQERLGVLAKKHDLDASRVALFGFSQGAMVAADICTRFPDSYAGAIIMSPGGMTNPQPAMLPSTKHKAQVFWVVCMAEEHPGNVELSRVYARHLKELGAQVTKLEYPGIKEHTRPPDFAEKFPDWIGSILHLGEAKDS